MNRSSRFLLAVCAAAALIRAAYVVRLPPALATSDEIGYVRLAEHLLDRHEYSIQPGHPTAYRAPGYPFFLAAVYAILPRAYLSFRLAQAALGGALCALVYGMGRRLVNERAARWSAVLAAVHPYLIYYTSGALTELLFTVLLALACWLFLRWADTGRARDAAFAGAALGLACLTRPVATLFPFALVVWMWRTRREAWLQSFGAAVLVLGLVVAPWLVRNALVFHDFVPIGAEGGQTLWMGNNPNATGGGETYEDPEIEARGLTEAARDRAYRSRAWAYIFANPGRTVRMAVKKAWLLWRPVPHMSETAGRREQLISLAYSFVYFPLFAFGLALAWKTSPKTHLLTLLILYMTAIHMLFVAQIRFRLPLEPAICVFAGLALERLTSRRSTA